MRVCGELYFLQKYESNMQSSEQKRHGTCIKYYNLGTFITYNLSKEDKELGFIFQLCVSCLPFY